MPCATGTGGLVPDTEDSFPPHHHATKGKPMPDTFTSAQEFRAQLARLIDAATKAKIHPTLIGNILEDASTVRMRRATTAPFG
jgi:hypothetical protein